MPTHFSRTSRALAADRHSSSLLRLALLLLLLAGWTLWFAGARVTTWVATERARLEVGRAAHSLESAVGGAVVDSRLAVGLEVQQGEVLLRLDATQPQLELDRERIRLQGLDAELAALGRMIDAEAGVGAKETAAVDASLEEARARFREADSAARYAEEARDRMERLRGDGMVSELDLSRARSEALKSRAAADALDLSLTRILREQEQRRGERDARVRELERDRAALAGAIATSRATMELLARRVDDCSVRAPVAGFLGETGPLRAGAVVVAGQKLATIVPAGELRAVAQFEPASALGRLKPGQRALLRLDAFPWAQYGSVAATVQSIASEVRDGAIRVELRLDSPTLGAIRLEHGLTGSAEVEVEQATPAQRVLRCLGEQLRGGARPVAP